MNFQLLLKIYKHNYKNIITIIFMFLFSVFSQTFASLSFKYGHNIVAIFLWIIFAISTLSVFFVTCFVLKFSEDFYNHGRTIKFWTYIIILLSAFILFTVVFVVFRYIPSLSFLDFVSFPCIVHMLVSVAVLGISVLRIR